MPRSSREFVLADRAGRVDSLCVPRAYIAGTGAYLPPRVVTNHDLITQYGIQTTDEWIVQRTGISERRFADAGIGPADLAKPAADAALAQAELVPDDLDMIVFATLSPEFAFPGSGVLLQAALGLTSVPAMDLRNQCSGFVYALSVGASMIQSGTVQNVLVVGAEVHSAALDLTTRGRNVSTIFGDGAGAVVLRATDEPGRGVLRWQLGADGRHAEDLAQRIWDTRARPFIPLDENGWGRVDPKLMWAQMDGRSVFKHAVERMTGQLLALCWDHQIALDDLDQVFFHQANIRINQAVRESLGLKEDRVPTAVQKYGNTTAATIPILLAEATRDGRVKRGDLVALVAFGSGFTWGGAIVRW